MSAWDKPRTDENLAAFLGYAVSSSASPELLSSSSSNKGSPHTVGDFH